MPRPTIVQARHSTLDPNCVSSGNSSLFFPEPTLSGNGLLLLLQSGATGTYTVADDQSQSWTHHGTTVTSGQKFEVFYRPNSAAGVRKVTVTLASGTNSYLQFHLIELYNTDLTTPIDSITTMAGASPTGLTWGSMNVTTNSSLVIGWAAQVTSGDPRDLGTAFTAGTGGELHYCEPNFGIVLQTQPSDINAAFVPGVTVPSSGSDVWTGLAICLKGVASATGTAPSATDIRIVKIATHAIAVASANPYNFRCPIKGNLAVFCYIGQPATSGNAIISTLTLGGNSCSQAGTDASNTGIGTGQMFYRANVTPGDTINAVLTPNQAWSGGGFHSLITVFDIVNADASSPLDATNNASGNQSASGNLTTSTITPASQPGLTILTGVLNAHAVADCTTPGTYRFDGAYQAGTDGGDTVWYEADPIAHTARHTTTSGLTYVFTTLNNTAGVGEWATVAAAFKEAVSGAVAGPLVGAARLKSLVGGGLAA